MSLTENFTGTLSVVNGSSYALSGTIFVNETLVVGVLTDGSGSVNFNFEAERTGAALDRLRLLTQSILLPGGQSLTRDLNAAIASASISLGTPAAIVISGASGSLGGNPVTWGLNLSQASLESALGGISDRPISIQSETLAIQVAERINKLGSSFDNLGFISGTERLSEESNYSYRKRSLEALSQPGSGTSEGLSIAIARDLGLKTSKKLSVRINPLLPRSLYKNVRLLIESGKIKVYEAWVSNRRMRGVESWSIAKTDQGVPFDFLLEDYSIGELADLLGRVRITDDAGAKKRLFNVSLVGAKDFPAESLISFDSRQLITEALPPQRTVRLSQGNIFENSLVFEEAGQINREVGSEALLSHSGDYYVDYDLGRLIFKRPPSLSPKVSYVSYSTAMTLSSSPVFVADMQTESASEIYFEQHLMDFYDTEEEKHVNGLPTNRMFGLLRRILTSGDYLHYWGE